MSESYEALRLVQLGVFVSVAVAGLFQWARRRSQAAAWMAASLAVLAAVSLAARFLPNDGSSRPDPWLFKVLVGVLPLFPYFLYKFHASLIPAKRWIRIMAGILTAATVLSVLFLPEFPATGEPRPPVIEAWILLLAVQWVFLSSRVVFGLWRSGRGQPAVTRRRMRTIALGAATLSLLVVVGAVSPPGARIGARQFLTTTLATLSAPLFLLGFAPPRMVVAAWRRKDDVALREAEIGLIKAINSEQVAELLLPGLSRFMGGGGTLLTDRQGKVFGSHGLNEQEVLAMRSALQEDGQEVERTPMETVKLERGWLIVCTSVLAPYFGDDERKTLQAIGTLTDMALARAELLERERQSLETMRDFVAIASHDLRTPIAVISGIGMTIRQQWDRLSDEQRLDLMGRVESQADHLGRLVEDLLTVSRIEAGFVGVHPESMEIAPIIDEVLREISSAANPVKVDVPPGVRVIADPDHCRRILRNYLTNAFNYGGHPVSVEVRSSLGWVELRVMDSGKGVPQEFVPRLFEKFARAERKMSRSMEGTGLGLSIVKGLAKAMGGDAFYEENHPTGAVFGVRLRAPAGATPGKDTT
ncbi:MAG TPA: HAMP domain-containing sensor histidine kinase [Actinomycetota bacterium]|nr:HAMP domain-containing sensor histidine kinase [Actinomycetota bacterium]